MNEETNQRVWPVVVFVATVMVLLCLIIKMFLVTEVSSTLVMAIALICGLLIISPRVSELAELTISKDGLIAKINDVEQKATTTEHVVKETERKIDQLFANTMSDSMYGNLTKLESGTFGPFANNGGLRRELRHLRDVGYIDLNRHVGDLPDNGPDLSQFATVTPVGKDFVALRESLESVAGEKSEDA